MQSKIFIMTRLRDPKYRTIDTRQFLGEPPPIWAGRPNMKGGAKLSEEPPEEEVRAKAEERTTRGGGSEEGGRVVGWFQISILQYVVVNFKF